MYASKGGPLLMALRAGIGRLKKPTSNDLIIEGFSIGALAGPWLAMAAGVPAEAFLPFCVAIASATALAFLPLDGRSISLFVQIPAIAILLRLAICGFARRAERVSSGIWHAIRDAGARFVEHIDPRVSPLREAAAFALGVFIAIVAILAVGLGPQLRSSAIASPVFEQIDPTSMTWRVSRLPEIVADGI